MKKAGILLSILLLSLIAFALPISVPATKDENPGSPTSPNEMNHGVGRPYQDITNFTAVSDGTNLSLTVTLKEGPPKEDAEHHLSIYMTIDTDNTTNSGADWFPHETNARYKPAKPGDGPGGGHLYTDRCVALYQWTTVQSIEFLDSAHTPISHNIVVTNSSDGRNVTAIVPLSDLGNPPFVTLGVITVEGYKHDWSGEPNLPPYPTSAHIFRDTIGNASFDIQTAAWGQWLNVEHAIKYLYTGAGNSTTVSDAVNDFVVLPCNDITDVNVGQGSLIVNVTFANMTNMSPTGQFYMWTGRWEMAIAIDTDGIPGSGQHWFPVNPQYRGFSDVRIDPAYSNTYWERCVVVDTPLGVSGYSNRISVYDTSFNDLGTGGIVATFTLLPDQSGVVSVNIPVGALALGMPAQLNLTVISGQNWANMIEDVVGTWSYEYNSSVNTQGYYLVKTSLPPTEEILPEWPGPEIAGYTQVGRPYQDITNFTMHWNGTDLLFGVVLREAPPKQDNETHVNIYIAIDNGTAGGNWRFPDGIDAGYVNSTYFWEYCLIIYNWTRGPTGTGAQYVDLLKINEYVTPPRTPSLTRINALSNSVGNVTIWNSTNVVWIQVPDDLLKGIATGSKITVGVVTSEDYAKVRDTVGVWSVRLSFSQWIQVEPAFVKKDLIVSTWYNVTDPSLDFVGKAFWNILGKTVTEENYYIVINLTFSNLTAISWSMHEWRLAIAIDTDHVAGSGQPFIAFIGFSDTRISSSISNAYWERCVVIDSPADIHYYDEAFNDYGSSGITATIIEAEAKVRVFIPSWIIPPPQYQRLNLTIICGMDSGPTVYEIHPRPPYGYAYNASVNTQGYFEIGIANIIGAIVPVKPAGKPFNTAMGRPYQDIVEVWANKDASNLNVSVTLNEASLKEDHEAHVNIYVALDTKDTPAGQDWFPDNIDARYNCSKPQHYWEYCLAVYTWTDTQDVDLVAMTWNRTDALSNPVGNVTVTNSTDGRTVNMTIPLALIGNPATVTIGVVTSEDFSKVKDTAGKGAAIPMGWQWVEIEPAIIDLSSSASMSEPDVKDFCGKAFWDITGVSVGANATDILFNVTFLDVSGLKVNWDHWWLSLMLDLDHVAGSGLYFAYGPGVGGDANYVNMSTSCWDLDLVIDSLDSVSLWNITNAIIGWQTSIASNLGTAGTRVSLIEAQNKICVAIPKDNFKGHNWDYNLTVTVVCGTDAGFRVSDIYGSYSYVHRPDVAEYTTHGNYHITTDPSLNQTGPYKAILNMLNGALNISTINLDLDQYFPAGDAHLVARFYTYAGKSQLNKTIKTGISDGNRVTLNTNITIAPTADCISIVEIVLTSDDELTVYSVVARFIVTRTVLIQRLAVLDILWIYNPPIRPQIFLEIVVIDAQWPYAPA